MRNIWEVNTVTDTKEHWMQTYYVPEAMLFVIASFFLFIGYTQAVFLFDMLGCVFASVGILLVFIRQVWRKKP